jgi:hypothetical protein
MAYRSKAPENLAQFEDAAALSKEGGKNVLNPFNSTRGLQALTKRV